MPAHVDHAELWGTRSIKTDVLWINSLKSMNSVDVSPDAAPWRFKPTDKLLGAKYRVGFSVADLFSPNGNPAPGIVTTQDEFAISWSNHEAAEKVEALLATHNEAEAREIFRLCSQDQWSYRLTKKILPTIDWKALITPILYRPFDVRYTVYDSHVAVHRRERATLQFFKRNNTKAL